MGILTLELFGLLGPEWPPGSPNLRRSPAVVFHLLSCPKPSLSLIGTWEDTIIDTAPRVSIRCCPVRYGHDYLQTKRTARGLGRGRFPTLHPPTPPCLENLSQDGGSTGSKPLDPSFIHRACLLILEVSSQTDGLPLSR